MSKLTCRKPVGLRLGALLLPLILAGCGFHLRGTAGDSALQDLRVEGLGAGDPLMAELAGDLKVGGGQLVSVPDGKTGVVHVYHAHHNRRSLGLSRFGRTNTFDLSYRLVFDVRSPGGEVILPRQEIEVRRDYFNDQTLPLAQVQEEGVMKAEMLKEAAQTLLRRAQFALRKSPPPKKL